MCLCINKTNTFEFVEIKSNYFLVYSLWKADWEIALVKER